MSTPAPTARRRKNRERFLIGGGSVAALLLCWEVAGRSGLINPRFASYPTRVLSAGWALMTDGGFAAHVYVSLAEFAIGFGLALAVGIPLGMIMGWSGTMRYLLDPPVMALYATPRLALLPMLVLWLGVGMESKIAVVFIGAAIPILVNTMAGVREADSSLVQAARSYCATRLDIFVQILLPGSLPAVMSGIRLGLGRGLLGVVVGEMYAATRGVGHLIITYGNAVRMDSLIFLVCLVSLFGYVATTLVRSVENRLRNWRVS